MFNFCFCLKSRKKVEGVAHNFKWKLFAPRYKKMFKNSIGKSMLGVLSAEKNIF